MAREFIDDVRSLSYVGFVDVNCETQTMSWQDAYGHHFAFFRDGSWFEKEEA